MNRATMPVDVPAPSHRGTLALAAPVMLANLSTPLIGIVDTAVVGRLPDPVYIGAVALGALIFTFVFWAFGFLRMGTTGLTAQAHGAGDPDEVAAGLARALLGAAVIGVALIALQWPLRSLALALLAAPDEVDALARGYFDIRIWAAPVALTNYALIGWFVGLGRTRTALVLQLVLNLTNIALDAWFVLVLHWDVAGVAAGTLVAECVAALVGLLIARRAVAAMGGAWVAARIFDAARLGRTVTVNRDIMVRSLALIGVFVWFMAAGARHGTLVLAANAILMHLVSGGAYFLDGLAHAAEVLVGRAVGARAPDLVGRAVVLTTLWAVLCALVVTLSIAAGGAVFIDLLTVDEATRALARVYLPWVIAAPLLGVWAFQLDGIFIGATLSAEMRRAMLAAFAVFILAWWALLPFGNHGLWAALSLHYLARAGAMLYYYPRLGLAVRACRL